VRMLEGGDRPRFAVEALAELRIGRELGGQDFDGDRAIQASVAGFVDLALCRRRRGRIGFRTGRHACLRTWAWRRCSDYTRQVSGTYGN
jgi:hypothetical protein